MQDLSSRKQPVFQVAFRERSNRVGKSKINATENEAAFTSNDPQFIFDVMRKYATYAFANPYGTGAKVNLYGGLVLV